MKFLLWAVTVIFTFSAVHSEIIKIPSDKRTIQDGIDLAKQGDIVLVAPGTYNERINFKGKSVTVASFFILDADTSFISKTIISANQENQSDSGSVVYMISGEDSNSVLIGFTLEGGTGTDISRSIGFKARAGGAVLAFTGGTFRNNIIRNNSASGMINGAGAGIYAGLYQGGFLVVEDNVISNNKINAIEQAVGAGVALYNIDGRIKNNIISGNGSEVAGKNSRNIVGGGIFCESYPHRLNTVYISTNTIDNNYGTSTRDILPSYGGGVASWFTDVIIKDNTIYNNRIENQGMAFGSAVSLTHCSQGSEVVNNKIYNNKTSSLSFGYGSLSIMFSELLEVSENSIINNRNRNGGAMFIMDSEVINVDANTIKHNTAFNNGGGIYIINSDPVVTNNIVVNNHASRGGGINFYSIYENKLASINYQGNQEKGFCRSYINRYKNKISVPIPAIVNNTIINNTAETVGGGLFSNSDSILVLNSIIWSNSAPHGEQLYAEKGHPHIYYSNIQDTLWPGSGNINADPLFNDSLLNLAITSRCIGSGYDSMRINGSWYYTPAFDFDGDPRPLPYFSRPDIGAQEHSHGIPKPNILDQANINSAKKFTLYQNYPNPFNPKTNIRFTIPESEFIELKIYNTLGQIVSNLVSQTLSAGDYKFVWDATDESSGIYFVVLTGSKQKQTNRIILIK